MFKKVFFCLFLSLLSSQIFVASVQAAPPGMPPGAFPSPTPWVNKNKQPGCHYVERRHFAVEAGVTQPYGISDTGSAVGSYSTYGAYYAPASWNGGTYQVEKFILLRPFNCGASPASCPPGVSLPRAVTAGAKPVVVGLSTWANSTYPARAYIWQYTGSAGDPRYVTENTAFSGALRSVDQTIALGLSYPTSNINVALDVSNPIGGTHYVAVGYEGSTASGTVAPDSLFVGGMRPTVPAGGRAVFWDVSASAGILNNPGSNLAPTDPSYAAKRIPGLDNVNAMAKAVNDLGNIVGTKMGPAPANNLTAFFCAAPCTSTSHYTDLPALPGHTSTYAADINNWRIANGEPGQVFGYSSDGTNTEAVVWRSLPSGWSVTPLLDPGYLSPTTGRHPTLSEILTAGSAGAVAGVIDGTAYLFRDGSDPFPLSDAVYIADSLNRRVNYTFNRPIAMNDRSDMIARDGNGRLLMMRPTYYSTYELSNPAGSSFSLAQAVSQTGFYVLGNADVGGVTSAVAWKVDSLDSGPNPAPIPAITIDNNAAYGGHLSLFTDTAFGINGDGNGVAWNLSGSSVSSTVTLSQAGELVGQYYGPSLSPAFVPTFAAEKLIVYSYPWSYSVNSVGGPATKLKSRTNSTTVTGSEIADVTESGNAAGTLVRGGTYRAHYWSISSSGAIQSDEDLTSSFDGFSTHANAVNIPADGKPYVNAIAVNRSAIVGYAETDTPTALLWERSGVDSGSWKPADNVSLLQGGVQAASQLNDVNGLIQAVGTAEVAMKFLLTRSQAVPENIPVGYMYDRFNVSQSINQLSAVFSPTSQFVYISDAQAINDRGWIVGNGVKKDGSTASVLLVPPAEGDLRCQ